MGAYGVGKSSLAAFALNELSCPTETFVPRARPHLFDPDLDDVFGVSNDKQRAHRLAETASLSLRDIKDRIKTLEEETDRDDRMLVCLRGAMEIKTRLNQMQKVVREQRRGTRGGEPDGEATHDPSSAPVPELSALFQQARTRVFIVSALLGETALDRLLCEVSDVVEEVRVYARWSPEDIASGATDWRAWDVAKRHNVTLYACPGLHAKMYIADHLALVGSANATARGLGLGAMGTWNFSST